MSALERHCGWLLRAYPAWYRRQRAGEMLGTLLETSPPGRRWPSLRDAVSLVGGGLRVRGWTWLLSGPLLVAGFVRLRAWRSRNWLRAAGWAGSWVAGLALINQAADWASAGEHGNRGVLGVGEMAICAAWLALGAVMTWILAVPRTQADSSRKDSTVATR